MHFHHSPAAAGSLPQTSRPVMSYVSMAACVLLTLLAISAIFPNTLGPPAPVIMD